MAHQAVDQSSLPLPATTAVTRTVHDVESLLPNQPDRLLILLSNVTGVDAAAIGPDTVLADLGIDLLMCMEPARFIETLLQSAITPNESSLAEYPVDPASGAKPCVYETDASRHSLGLSVDEYEHLLAAVAHVIHNAWPMTIARPVRDSKPSFARLANSAKRVDRCLCGKHFVRMACGGVVLHTQQTARILARFSALKAVDPGVLKLFVQYWRKLHL
ncbi:acyl carrier protein [Aspergillus fischeri NRRL 181]|uniref:Thioester reductase (TE) domain-containing protein n=1 Tax=Neosartorya fischeri (strain ATCC 1020 / DSM 3700 / CBS 544.65 / FGSC A1164 / JCM 1740 / NRRL 181 / WB 181) TaxID=331117 RepID=A1DAL4_NEOFI|nr:uncharacterized protein NFIA_095240 [Aspergillus fischeri NRRL 181]EAW19904.1 hypothetical protein NFIA_095240 [Aspergillus fischeri NRRL 181]KAG2009345.1 hypothetical protein GB937_007748 [Aspergillus fischeri]